MFEPVTKWNQRVERVEAIPEIVRKAFRVAQLEKPGPTHIELPGEPRGDRPSPTTLRPLDADADLLPRADRRGDPARRAAPGRVERPLVLAGNGVLRRQASARAARLRARACTSRWRRRSWARAPSTTGPTSRSWPSGSRRATTCCRASTAPTSSSRSGYDLVEYAPSRWNPDGRKRIIHIDTQPAEVDARYQPEVELVGDIDGDAPALLAAVLPQGIGGPRRGERHATRETLVHAGPPDRPARRPRRLRHDDGWPIKPQRAIADLRRALGPRTSSFSDVGAHKIWVARLYQAYEPNTVIISNGFAAMGISLPGAIAAKLVHPDRRVVALCGDGGFLMNSQELETAKRIGANITVVVWRDDGYGLIDWKQRNEFGRPFGVEFGNPDFVAYAQSFGLAAYRRRPPAELYPTLERALEHDGPSLVEVPIDYRENLRLTERLGALSGRG